MSYVDQIKRLQPDEFIMLPDSWMVCKRARYSIEWVKKTTSAQFKTRKTNGFLYVTRVK